MARGLQLVQATFSIRQPDANGTLAEKNDGQNGRLRPQIQPQGLRAKLEGTWGSGQRHHTRTETENGRVNSIDARR